MVVLIILVLDLLCEALGHCGSDEDEDGDKEDTAPALRKINIYMNLTKTKHHLKVIVHC